MSALIAKTHPGGIVRRQCLESIGLTVSAAAKILGVTRKTLSELVNERKGISPEMALRLAMAFGSTPETWLTLQMNYELARAEEKAKKKGGLKVPKVTEKMVARLTGSEAA